METKNKVGKLKFILDLDESIISAEATEEYDFEKHKNKRNT